MALKQWHKTRWNGDKWNKDGSNTDREMAYSSTYTTPPPPSPNRASLSMNTASYVYMYFSLTTCTVRLYIISKAIEVSYLMHMTYTTSIKQQTLSKSGFSWVYMCRYTNISDSWDILLFNRRKLKKKTLKNLFTVILINLSAQLQK